MTASANLENMTLQEIFNIVYKHLMTQKSRSMCPAPNQYLCAYRGQDGKKCAIGALIPDELYSPEMEGKSVYNWHYFPESVAPFLRKNLIILQQLQQIHDVSPVQQWPEELKNLAGRFALTIPEMP